MKTVSRAIALTVVLSLVLGGPLAPLASAQQSTAPKPDVMQEAMKASAASEPNKAAYDVGAGVANVFFVPGKVVLCGMSSVFSLTLLAITFGNAYREAAGVAREGCGGKWTLVGEDLRPAPETRRPFEWETN